MKLRFERYIGKVSEIPITTRKLRVWIPAPQSNAVQKIEQIGVYAESAPSQRDQIRQPDRVLGDGESIVLGRVEDEVCRVTLSAGPDITLEPKQDGPPLNYFLNPYAEADGKPVKTDKSWSYQDID